MTNTLFRHFMFCAGLCLALAATAQQQPQLKVDISITNRQAQEVQEPGYTLWQVNQGKSDQLDIDGITFTLTCPADAPYELRTGWSKSYIQNAAYKEQNGRLTFDGISLDPRSYGTITLRIDGLPAGTHTLQTFHNCWENPTAFYAAPFCVKVNGLLTRESVAPTFLQSVAANTTIVTTTFSIASEGDAVELEFSTDAARPGQPDAAQPNEFTAPLLNGFELNTVSVTTVAKEPFPANNDIHADADSGSITLTWKPASTDIVRHHLYFGPSDQLLQLLATLSEASYTVGGLYSMNTYCWRVDEEDAQGHIEQGQVWTFKPRQLAFPGAEGYGRFAQGGRGGSVYHVTNLRNDHTPGSLLYGLVDIAEPHTIVFDVSGIIEMDFGAVFSKPYITIAGQTAPGKGICLKGSNVNIGSDNICRHIRFKRGYGETGNAMGLSGSDHAIVDHCTAAWGTDETVSGRGARNVSFQYSIITEALGIADHKNYGAGTNHGFAATIDGKIGSWHHNLLAHCNGRNWSLGGGMDGTNTAIGQMDIFNNVVYNWNSRTTDGNCHEVNFVGNYYKMGPDTRRTVLFTQQYENVGSPQSTWRAYISGNLRENKNHTLTTDKKGDTYDVQLSNGDPGPTYETVVEGPFFPSYATIHSAQDAFKIVTSSAGATMPQRDSQHLRNVRETVQGTYTFTGSRSGIKGEIDHESDAGGWEEWPEETRPADFDTDQDGVPDWYEQLAGSNPSGDDHNSDPDRDGWTLLEDYLEFMAHPYLVLAPGTSATIDLSAHFAGFTRQPVFTLTDTATDGLFTATVNGPTATVTAGRLAGLATTEMSVADADGTTYTQHLGIAVTSHASAIRSVGSDAGFFPVSSEFYTPDGRRASQLTSHEVYLLRQTDATGQVRTVKIIKD